MLIRYIILLFSFFVNTRCFSQNDCNTPGDRSGKPGCPDPTGKCPPSEEKRFGVAIILSADPNEIIGPPGYDSVVKWVSVNAILPYKILFENNPSFATAPAQKVQIYLPVSQKLNPYSLRLGDFGFGSFLFSVPPNTTAYTTRLDVKDSLGVFVDVTAGLDLINSRAFWIFESIDTATGLASSLPPSVGFLPVNDSTKGNGEGFVSLTLVPLSNDVTRDTAKANATIIFDEEESLATNTWSNLIDAVAPHSNVDTLPLVADPSFRINWTAQDDSLGSGIANYDLYVSQNAAPFYLFQAAIDSTHLDFVGQPGVTYSFYTRAVDNTGNREPVKTSGFQNVTVRLPNSTICPGANISFNVPDYGAGFTYQWQVDSTGAGYVGLSNDAINSGVATRELQLNTPPTSYYGYKYRCVVSNGGTPIINPFQVLKFSTTWIGSAGTSWENPANWNCNTVPDGFTDVIIPSVSTVLPQVNSNAACHSLTLKPGTSLTVAGGYLFNIKGK
jgi:hypothetical protein